MKTVWDIARKATEDSIESMLKKVDVRKEFKMGRFETPKGEFQLVFAADRLIFNILDEKIMHMGFVVFEQDVRPFKFREIGYFLGDIRYKFDMNSISEQYGPELDAEHEYPHFDYMWRDDTDDNGINLLSLEVTLNENTSAKYSINGGFRRTMERGWSFGFGRYLPESIAGLDSISIKNKGETTNHNIKWCIESEIMKLAIYEASRFEELVKELKG